MPALVLDLLKYIFLVILYIFVARAVRAVYMELRPQTRIPSQRSAAPAAARPASRKSKKAPRRITVIESDNLKGKSFDLDDEVIIGRADKCSLVLDDTYVSQIHARIFRRGDSYMIEDMGSTNGTYVNRRRITAAAELQRGDQVKIGKAVLELRK